MAKRWIPRRGVLGVSALTAFSVVVGTLAVAYDGVATANVELNDGGVWVTSGSDNLVGHLNPSAGELTTGLYTLSSDIDIAQDGSTVVVSDFGNSSANQVDVAQSVFAAEKTLGEGELVLLGGSTVVVVNAARQGLWVSTGSGFGSIDTEGPTNLEFPEPAAVTVGPDGTVHAALPTAGEIWSAAPAEYGGLLDATVTEVEGLSAVDELEISTAGSTPVILDRRAGVLHANGDQRPVPVDARLQQPGHDPATVLLATEDELFIQPLDGGEPRTVAPGVRGGAPAAPVQLNGCAYAAWSGTSQYLRDCGSVDLDLALTVPGNIGAGRLVFRVNRDVVVLNNADTGGVWLTDDRLTPVDNWQDVTPPEQDAEDENEDGDRADSLVADMGTPERTEDNNPPVANDDEYGVRPGRTTILPVLGNDIDPDFDVLVATVTSEPAFGSVQSIQRGSALQITVPEDASGTTTFEYEANDGRGGTDTATVTLRVRDWSLNDSPEQVQVPTVVVEQGQSVEYRVLDDWIDPDGDEIFLVTASTATADEVRFTPDGLVTFRDVGTTSGRKQVTLVVSDGTGTTEGALYVDVRTSGDLPPVANPDHAQTTVGREVTVSPLLNDTDPNGDDLRLARIDDVAGAQVVPDYDVGTFSFIADREGVYYLLYDVTDGPNTVQGLVRIDVLADSEDQAPPVVVRDLALVPQGGEALVDVLANDVDPAGGVLVVQAVEVPQDSGVQAAVIDHQVLRIVGPGVIEEPVTIEYTAANVYGDAVGQVLVLPVPRPAVLPPPVAADDEVTVRAGDVVDISVLANDFHPADDVLTVEPELVQGPEDGQGLAFVSGNQVRFLAGDEAGTVYLIYEVVDSMGQSDSAQITIHVREIDPETNLAPRPLETTARVLAGATTRIPVLLTGVDPDGDSVTLTGIDKAPSLGTVTATGRDWIEYTATSGVAGTDVFTYAVQDQFGARSVADVRFGIATPGPNQAPIAVDDQVSVRPGRVLWIDPLANDLDPDGDDLILVDNGLEVVAGDIDPVVVGNRIEVTAPDEETTAVMYYTVADPSGATAVASITLLVTENAELLRPIARDDVVELSDVGEPDANGEVLVTVPVLENDEDPDGRSVDLQVTVDHPEVQVDSDGVVTLPVRDQRQIVPYHVTDVDGLTGSAFIWLPGLVDDRRPVLKDHPPVEVESGEEVLLGLEDYVQVAPGRTPRITEAESVSAVNSDGSSPLVDATTLRFVSAEGYHGPAGVTFEVTDGSGPDDPDGRTAVLTILITVLPGEEEEDADDEEGSSGEEEQEEEVVNPPQFAGATIQVAPGEAATTLDLRTASSSDAPGGVAALTYALAGSAPSGYTTSLAGSVLSVSAAASTPAGSATTVSVTVSDGIHEPVAGVVQVVVVSSTRQLAVVNDDVVPAAHQGQAVRVDVLNNDVSPFPGEPLTLVGSPVVETAGSGTAVTEGSQVVVTPGADFVGTMAVRYQVADVTGDPARHVSGRILLTVQGRPAAPATPTVTEVRSETVVLTWSPPTNNGAEITGYTVRSGGFSQQCAATTCTLTGLTNDVEYRFTVTATNAVGESEPSPESAAARPDARPSRPSAPTLTFGDQQLGVAWTAPTGYAGSAVESYNVRISPAPPSGSSTRTGVTGTSLTWEGLANGTAYRFEVQAVNRAPDPSEWSPASAAETPAGIPATPAQPATELIDPVGDQAQMRVSWVAPANNGAEISTYALAVYQGSTLQTTLEVPGGQTSQAITLTTSVTNYTFTVQANNRAGASSASVASAPRRAVVAPGAPGNVTAAPRDRAVEITFTAAPGNGARPEEIVYQYQLNSGTWVNAGTGTGPRNVSGLSNGSSYQVAVRAVATVDGVQYAGPSAAAPAAVVPFGPPNQPGLSCAQQGQNQIRFSWTVPAQNGRPYTNLQVQHRLGNGSWSSWGNRAVANGSADWGNAHSQQVTARVRVQDSEGQWSQAREASCTTRPPPPPTGTLSWGEYNTDICANCRHVILTYANFPAGNRNYTCHFGSGSPQTRQHNFSTSGSFQTHCVAGINMSIHIEVHGVMTTAPIVRTSGAPGANPSLDYLERHGL